MPQFRRDPLSDHWVILAPNRSERPEQWGINDERKPSFRCPFCRGNEADTPSPLAALSAAGESCSDADWQVRVIPNKYPAVRQDAPQPPDTRPFFDAKPGYGIHEVIIETPDHEDRFTNLEDRQISLVFQAYRQRLLACAEQSGLAYAQIFKNSGAAAGASLEHAHSQLIATPVVPTQVQRELDIALGYYEENHRCVFCDMLIEELSEGSRILLETDRFVAFCPFASQFPYETWIIPREHHSKFEDTEDIAISELARLVRSVLLRVEATLQDPAFNYLIHTSPLRSRPLTHYHWHLELFPRVNKTAGFEWGSGDYINTVAPEQAARALRNAQASGS